MRRSSVRFVTGRLIVAALILVVLSSCGSDAGVEAASVPAVEPAQAELEAPPIAFANEDEASEPADSSEPEEAVAAPEDPSATEPDTETVAEPSDTDAADVGDGLFPIVVDAIATSSDGTSWRFDVTLSSEYATPERYADAWRVLDGDDTELGIRVLGHDHANEQPFTRSHTVDVPEGTTTVFIEGRDQVNGWSGERFELTLTS